MTLSRLLPSDRPGDSGGARRRRAGSSSARGGCPASRRAATIRVRSGSLSVRFRWAREAGRHSLLGLARAAPRLPRVSRGPRRLRVARLSSKPGRPRHADRLFESDDRLPSCRYQLRLLPHGALPPAPGRRPDVVAGAPATRSTGDATGASCSRLRRDPRFTSETLLAEIDGNYELSIFDRYALQVGDHPRHATGASLRQPAEIVG